MTNYITFAFNFT